MGRWLGEGLDFVRAEQAAERSRELFAALVGAAARDVALVPSVSAAAGLVAAQFVAAWPGENLVIGAQEYSSNHFPWRQLERRGYEVRQVPFRDGGMEADDVRAHVDGGTRMVAASAIQTASGHRSDLRALAGIARGAGAWLFVDASQAAGAVDLSADIAHVDFLSTSDHKFLLNAARGMGYLYIRREVQDRLLPLSAGWRAGAAPFESFFGPRMELSPTASRFDQSISWLAAIGDEACLGLIHAIGPSAIAARVAALATRLRAESRTSRWTRRAAATSSPCRWPAAIRRPSWPRSGRRASRARRATATSASRRISTTTRRTSRRRWPPSPRRWRAAEPRAQPSGRTNCASVYSSLRAT